MEENNNVDDVLVGENPSISLPAKDLKGAHQETSITHAAEDVSVMLHVRRDGRPIHEDVNEICKEKLENMHMNYQKKPLTHDSQSYIWRIATM